jgi:hypothetical protein
MAIESLRSSFPELAPQQNAYSWRTNRVEFECDDQAISRVTVQKSETGSASDVRTAAATIGARMTRDTTTAVRAALDRCMSQATRSNGTADTNSSRALIECRIDATSLTLSVSTRPFDREPAAQPKA